ncbi:MAG: hypothetical protein ABR509_05855 [Candidatus Limnocylindria bacterium]
MDERTRLIPAPGWAVAETVDRAWVVAAAWLFGVSALVALYMALTGLASADAFHVVAVVPAGALLLAFAVLDPQRRWTVRIGAIAGACGGIVWLVALVEFGGSDALTALAMGGFAAGSFAAGRALAALERPGRRAAETPRDDHAQGWIEDVA